MQESVTKVPYLRGHGWILGLWVCLVLLLGHAGDLGEEELLQGLGHHHDVLAGLVVHVAVGEDGVEILNALLGGPVVVVVEPLLDGSEIHGVFDDLVVVWDVEFVGVDRCLEGPAELVLPDGLHHGVLEVEQLVGGSAGPGGEGGVGGRESGRACGWAERRTRRQE